MPSYKDRHYSVEISRLEHDLISSVKVKFSHVLYLVFCY